MALRVCSHWGIRNQSKSSWAGRFWGETIPSVCPNGLRSANALMLNSKIWSFSGAFIWLMMGNDNDLPTAVYASWWILFPVVETSLLMLGVEGQVEPMNGCAHGHLAICHPWRGPWCKLCGRDAGQIAGIGTSPTVVTKWYLRIRCWLIGWLASWLVDSILAMLAARESWKAYEISSTCLLTLLVDQAFRATNDCMCFLRQATNRPKVMGSKAMPKVGLL